MGAGLFGEESAGSVKVKAEPEDGNGDGDEEIGNAFLAELEAAAAQRKES